MKNANMNNMFGHALKVGDVLSTNSGSSYQIIGFINTGKNGAVFKVNRDDFQYNNSYFALKIQYNLLEKRLRRFEREQDLLICFPILIQVKCVLLTEATLLL